MSSTVSGQSGSSTSFTPLCLLSTDLQEAIAVEGMAELVNEVAGAGAGGALTRREFRLLRARTLRGDASKVAGIELHWEGSTLVPLASARADPLSPTIDLDGQRYFDTRFETTPLPVLLLIGGAATSGSFGHEGQRARMLGPLFDAPARPFYLAGRDSVLPRVMPALLGWLAETPRTSAWATALDHPLVALDALRIVARGRADLPFAPELLGWLLHPTQAPEARLAALSALAEILHRLPPVDPAAEAFLREAAWSFRLERQFEVEGAYLEVVASCARHVDSSSAGRELADMATDGTAARRLEELRIRAKRGAK
jgi:hypothetical protein